MMFEVRVETSFEADHRRAADGAEAPLHHHLWKVTVRARARRLDRMGMVVDFLHLRAAADAALGQLDQQVLEDLFQFAELPATPDAVAEWLYGQLASAVPQPRCWLEAVEVEADPGIRFEYVGVQNQGAGA